MPSNNLATLDPSRQLKPIVYRKPGEESKGGEYHGGPRRWTGKGPPPARHIPWPEIFKHHISVIEGHKKMVDMVRKHTVAGTGNWRTITDMYNRSDEMLKTSKQLSYTFIPPPGQRDQVPLGVASDSMYPGYSPADHEYGKAAEEYGMAVAEAKKRGVVIPKHPDIDYEIGQGKGIKTKTLAQMRAMKKSRSGSEGEGPEKNSRINGDTNSSAEETENAGAHSTDAQVENETLAFVIDTNPTPVKITNHLLSPSKRQAEDGPTEGKKSKKSKTKHSGDIPAADNKSDQTEDISAEVEARLKAKEEKRKLKEEKKRKRESEKSDVIPSEVGDSAEKPKKKKKKTQNAEVEGEQPSQKTEKKRSGEEGGNEGEKKKNKRRRKE